MRLTLSNKPRTFNLVSLGYRGVGKTVFLASSYAELMSSQNKSRSQQLWFECLDKTASKNLNNLLGYIAKTGKYPPTTMKVTNFSFSVKRRGLLGNKTLCRFRWWDLPGEICNFNNPDFESIVLNSHGCCLFIDAPQLIGNKNYLETIEDLIQQVEAIASLVQKNDLKYAFSLIFTKCDLLEGPLSLVKVEENLRPLTTRLGAAKAIYKQFYSGIPISAFGTTSVLQAQGTAAPLLWLTSKLRRLYRFQPPQKLATGFNQILTNSTKTASDTEGEAFLNLATLFNPRKMVILGLASLGLLGGITMLGFGLLTPTSESAQSPGERIQKYEKVLQRDPTNFDALVNLVTLKTELGQYSQAIPFLEQLIQQDPVNLDLRFELAGLYSLTGQGDKEEAVYDDILSQQQGNLLALTSKARLRIEQGDSTTAKMLFEQAENSAPTSDLKAKVQEIAQDALQVSAK